jgi:small subunit ribosomal protein S20
MPIKRSSIKDVRRTAARTARNLKIKERLHDLSKKIKKAVVAGDAKTISALAVQLQQTLDKAAKRHILHANAASRKVSRVMRTSRKK